MDAEVSIPNYNVLRADRANRKNGGVALYYHNSFTMEDMQTFTNSFCELAMGYNKQNNMIIVAIYRPPDAPIAKFRECLEKIENYKEKYQTATLFIMGDTNLKFINWNTESIMRPENIRQSLSAEERKSSEMLLDFVNENLLV